MYYKLCIVSRRKKLVLKVVKTYYDIKEGREDMCRLQRADEDKNYILYYTDKGLKKFGKENPRQKRRIAGHLNLGIPTHLHGNRNEKVKKIKGLSKRINP